MNIIKALVIVSLAYVVVACGGAEERKAAYLEKAEQSLNAGDLDKARIELKNVLQIDPKDAQAYFKLGNVFEQKKEYKKAFGNYSKAAELDPDNNEYQAKLGLFHLILARDVDKATEYMETILSRDPADVNGLQLKAGILLRQDKASDAMEISRQLFQDHPDNVENAIFLATLYGENKAYTDAIAVLDKALALNPGNGALQSALGNALFLNKEYDRSEQIWQERLAAHPDAFTSHLTLAKFYQRIGESTKAEEVLRKAIVANEDDGQRKLVLVEFIQQTKGNAEAINELKSLIKTDKDNGELRLALAQLQINEKDIDGAIATYKDAVMDFPQDETGITSRVQLAKVYMNRKEAEAARQIIDEAADIAPNDSAVNLVKAKIAMIDNNLEQAIISLRTVIKDDPENIEAYFLLAAAHSANNEESQAEEIIARAHENNRDNIKALLPLAQYHVRNKNALEAEKVIDDYLRLDDSNYDALSIKSAILNGKKNYQEAYSLAEKMVSQYPNKENGYIQSVPALLANKEVDKAIVLLRDGYQNTSSVQVLKLKAQVEIAAGKSDDAIASLGMVPEEDRDESTQLLIARAYAAKDDVEATKKTLRESIMEDKTRTQSYMSLAALYNNQNDIEQAISVMQDGVNANPDDARLGIALAGYYERAGDIDSAIKQYDTILADKPDNLLANNNVAALLADHRSDEASLQRARDIADKLKAVNQPVIMDTVGWVYYKSGDFTEAVNVLSQVVEAQPNVPVFNYHLGMAYLKSGNNEEAKKYLEAAVNSEGDYPDKDDAMKTLESLQ
jgi:tetratricopeptide (TPR) repeat protein